MFSIRDAEIVRDVVRHGGFRAAAAARGLSQSAISNRVAALEAALGVRLFDRSRRRVGLTAAGRRFLEETERLIGFRDRIADEFARAAPTLGTVRLGASETIVHARLPAMLARLRARAPSLRIELAVETSDELGRMLADDEIDVAALLTPFVPIGAASLPIGEFDMGWYAAASSELGDAPLEPEALARHPLVTFSRVSLPYQEVERLFADRDCPAPLVHGSASLSTVLAFVETGMGIGTLPRAIARIPEAEGRVARVDVVDALALTPLAFSLCWTRDPLDQLSELAANLVEVDD